MTTGATSIESVERSFGQDTTEYMRVMVVVGIATGVVVIGVGSRVGFGIIGAATLVGVVVDSVARPGSWTSRGRTRWLLPVLLIAAFSLTILITLFAELVVTVCFGIASAEPVQRMRATRPFGLIVQAAWLGIAVLGVHAVVTDVRDIA